MQQFIKILFSPNVPTLVECLLHDHTEVFLGKGLDQPKTEPGPLPQREAPRNTALLLASEQRALIGLISHNIIIVQVCTILTIQSFRRPIYLKLLTVIQYLKMHFIKGQVELRYLAQQRLEVNCGHWALNSGMYSKPK